MRRLRLIGAFCLGLALAAPTAQAFEFEDLLIEQILVSITQYRHTAKDFEALQSAARQKQPPGEDVMQDPAVKAFMEVSLAPADRAMRDLFARYGQEYGPRRLRGLAHKYRFEDLLDTD